MARFVARYARYSHGVREEIAEQFSRGTRVIQKSLEAQFDVRGLTDYDKEQAVKLLSFHGLPEDRDTGRDVSPTSRLSLFDSEAARKQFRWTEEEEELVLDVLRNSDRYGLDFVEIEQPKRPAPWSGYDRLEGAEKIAELTLATETDPAAVLAYERENEAREDVIAALEQLLDEQSGDDDHPITIEA